MCFCLVYVLNTGKSFLMYMFQAKEKQFRYVKRFCTTGSVLDRDCRATRREKNTKLTLVGDNSKMTTGSTCKTNWNLQHQDKLQQNCCMYICVCVYMYFFFISVICELCNTTCEACKFCELLAPSSHCTVLLSLPPVESHNYHITCSFPV